MIMSVKKTQKILIVNGPTASGKTSFALDLADQHDGEIINADSMQVYKELPILTAHPDDDERARAPHHLYGALSAAQDCSAEIWQEMASRQIESTLAAGKTPIIVGGTGFYIKALTHGLSPIPEIDPQVREQVTAMLDDIGHEAFHAALAVHDPTSAARLHPNDTHRMIRAWEVFQGTGKALSDWQDEPLKPPPASWEFEYHVIIRDREELIERINKRFDIMVNLGVIDEVQALSDQIDSGIVPEDALIIKAHGFRPIRRYLKGEWGLDDAAEHTKTETRQYAKRQMTWVRGQLPEDATHFHKLSS